MKKKFALSTVIALALIFVMAFSVCGMAIAEGSPIDTLKNADFKYLGGYTAVGDVVFGYKKDANGNATQDRYTAADLKNVKQMYDNGASFVEIFNAISANYEMVMNKAQMTTTLSDIDITMKDKKMPTTLVKGKQMTVNQISTWATVDTENESWTRTISGMMNLNTLPDGILNFFGYWYRSYTNREDNYFQDQKGRDGKGVRDMSFDQDTLGGVDCVWTGTPEKTPLSDVTRVNKTFNYATDLDFVSNPAEINYPGVKVEFDKYDLDKNGNEIGENWKYKRPSNFVGGVRKDENYKVKKITYDTVDGNGAKAEPEYDYLVWDEVEKSYKIYVEDGHGVCIPERHTGISNFVITNETIDNDACTFEEKTDSASGKKYYKISLKLKAGGSDSIYKTIDDVCWGEFKNMQGGTKGTVDFSADYTYFDDDITLELNVWDNGLIKEFYRSYKFSTGEDGVGDQGLCYVLGGSTGWADVTNTQRQVYAYDAKAMSFAAPLTKGSLTTLGLALAIAIPLLVVIIAVIVTLVILAKKGIIGKKAKAKKAAKAAEDNGVVDAEQTDVTADSAPAAEAESFPPAEETDKATDNSEDTPKE